MDTNKITNKIASEVVKTIVQQVMPFVGQHAAYLERLSKRKWKYKSPAIKEDENTVMIKWYPARAMIGDLEQFGLQIRYDIGPDSYTVKAFHVSKEGDIQWGREMTDIYFDQLSEPDTMWHTLKIEENVSKKTNYVSSGFIKSISGYEKMIGNDYRDVSRVMADLTSEMQGGVNEENKSKILKMTGFLSGKLDEFSKNINALNTVVEQEAGQIELFL